METAKEFTTMVVMLKLMTFIFVQLRLHTGIVWEEAVSIRKMKMVIISNHFISVQNLIQIYYFLFCWWISFMFSSYFLVLKPGDGSWGTWTPYKNCPNGSLASAFRLRIQDYQGNEILQFSLNVSFYICTV